MHTKVKVREALSGLRLDPVTIQLLWNRLISVVDEASSGLIRTAYTPDEEVVVHLELPGSEGFVLPARVVRYPGQLVRQNGKSNVAVSFIGLDETTRSQLLRWVYREEVRRHREESIKKQGR